MGWRNMYILIGEDKNLVDENSKIKKGSSIERILEYQNHHNYWYQHFSQDEIKKMEEEDTVPGEELILQVLVRENNNDKEYWAYLGNHGGSGWSIEWAERYFEDITIYDSGNFPYYDDNWQSWPIMSVEDYLGINLSLSMNDLSLENGKLKNE
tara:strand:- start:339 stop:797 length:459 start_codon:yes stop_codon:yes gene_type:complete